jgi:hypothetical protein
MKIYNKIVLEWNEKTQHYDKVVYEDSFEYEGELDQLAGHYQVGLCDDQSDCECPDDPWQYGQCNPVTGHCDYSSCGSPYGGGEIGDAPQCLDPAASGEDEYGNCIYGDEDIGGYTEETAASCTPGTMYYDWEGNLKYCPGGSGLYGDPLGEWQTGGGWETEADLPQGLLGEDSMRNIFDVLPPEVLQHIPPELWGSIGGSYAGIEERPEWESYLGDIRGLQAGTGAERRKAQEALRTENLYGGVSSSFAGGGGGVMPGRERTGAMSTFRDFLGEQGTERTGYELGFEESVEGLRSQWEEDIQTGYANVLAGEPTGYCTTCGPEEICMGKIDGEDNCVPYGEVDWSNIQETWFNPQPEV